MKSTERADTAHGLHLVVSDIEAAQTDLLGHGTEISELFHFEQGRQVTCPHPERSDYNSFFSFSDPDGNGWLVQEVKSRS
jgi:hypothetical protein